MGKNPSFLFYPNDWANDPQLKMAPPATRGIWMDLLCAMWWAPARGTVTGSVEDLCRLGNCSPEEMQRFVSDAQRLGFADVTFCNNQVTVANRRMVREQKERESTRYRVQRFRNKSSNASVTVASPSTPSTPVPTTPQASTKTLVPVVDKSTPWTDTLEDVRSFLLRIQAPEQFFNETYWLRIDQWLGSSDSMVAYFDEFKAYLAYIAAQNGHRKHKDLLRGFRNWLSTCSRWKERDAQRKAITSRTIHEPHSRP